MVTPETIIAEFEVGEEIRFKAYIYDYDQVTLIDPDSQDISIYTEDNLKYNTSSPSKEATGIYTVSYQSNENDELGVWYIQWNATIGSKTKIQRNKFRVVHSGKR